MVTGRRAECKSNGVVRAQGHPLCWTMVRGAGMSPEAEANVGPYCSHFLLWGAAGDMPDGVPWLSLVGQDCLWSGRVIGEPKK